MSYGLKRPKFDRLNNMTSLPLWAASILGDIHGVRRFRCIFLQQCITFTTMRTIEIIAINSIKITKFSCNHTNMKSGERGAEERTVRQFKKSWRRHRANVVFDDDDLVVLEDHVVIGDDDYVVLDHNVVVDDDIHVVLDHHFVITDDDYDYHRYAAKGGHNAILRLLLLQPEVDINTPDR